MSAIFSLGVHKVLLGVIVILVFEGTIHATNTDKEYRLKREIECEEKYKTITPDHTACKPPSDMVKASGVSDADKKLILDKHNTARRSVSPNATDMMLMTWDDEIANTAQRWAETCNGGHDENYNRYAFGRFSVGQNLAYGYADWGSALKGWEDEKYDYDYASNRSPTGKDIGHYTQMVWAKSSKIGCGYAKCGTVNHYACNYGPGGNSGGGKPYVEGETCSACRGRCNNKLCDCNGVVCLNGGVINYETCTCNCKSNLPFYLAPTCGLKCDGTEAPWCDQYKGASDCQIYTNVPQECPQKCNWCPSAAYKPAEDTTSSSRPTDSVTEGTTATTTAKAHTTVASAFIYLAVVLIHLTVVSVV